MSYDQTEVGFIIFIIFRWLRTTGSHELCLTFGYECKWYVSILMVDPSVVECVCERYKSRQFYTWAGPTLVACNPCRPVPSLYTHTLIEHHHHQVKVRKIHSCILSCCIFLSNSPIHIISQIRTLSSFHACSHHFSQQRKKMFVQSFLTGWC